MLNAPSQSCEPLHRLLGCPPIKSAHLCCTFMVFQKIKVSVAWIDIVTASADRYARGKDTGMP